MVGEENNYQLLWTRFSRLRLEFRWPQAQIPFQSAGDVPQVCLYMILMKLGQNTPTQAVHLVASTARPLLITGELPEIPNHDHASQPFNRYAQQQS